MKFICIDVKGPLEMFDVDESDIDYVKEEAIVEGSEEKALVIYLKDGRRCVSIATKEAIKEVDELKRLIR